MTHQDQWNSGARRRDSFQQRPPYANRNSSSHPRPSANHRDSNMGFLPFRNPFSNTEEYNTWTETLREVTYDRDMWRQRCENSERELQWHQDSRGGLIREIQKERRDNGYLQNRLQELDEDAKSVISKREQELKSVREEMDYYKGQKAILEQECSKFDAEIVRLRAIELKQKSSISSLNAKHKELFRQKKDQEELIRHAQARAFQSLERPEWAPPEDRTVRQQLDNLYSEIRKWSKVSAKGSVSDWGIEKLSPQEHQAFAAAFQGIALFDGPRGIPSALLQGTGDKKGWMFLTAWLSKFICETMFSNPFNFMEGWATEKTNVEHSDIEGLPNMGSSLPLSSVFSTMKQGNGEWIKEVQSWRAETLRLLDPQRLPHSPSTIEELKCLTERARERFASMVTKQFVQQSRFCLESERVEQLEKTVMRPAIEVAYQLFTQKSCLQYKVMTNDGSQYSIQPFYSSSSTFMEPSSVHLDEDEEALHGRIVSLVLFPALIMRGDSEGTDYNKIRILKKAVVLMEAAPQVEPVHGKEEDHLTLTRIKEEPV